MPPGAWMSVCCECCVFLGRSLCVWSIPHPEESYRMWCVVVCDLENSRMRWSRPALGRRAATRRKKLNSVTLCPFPFCSIYPEGCILISMNAWYIGELASQFDMFSIFSKPSFAQSKVLTTALLNIQFFLDVMLCWGVNTYRCFKISQWLHFQLLLDPENARISIKPDGGKQHKKIWIFKPSFHFLLFSPVIIALTLILLTWRIWWAPNNASRWLMRFNLAFKGLLCFFSPFIAFSMSVFHICWTERHGQVVVSNSASYQEGLRVNYWPGGRLPWNCCFFSVYWERMAIHYLRLGNKHFSTNLPLINI
jgi:hypothetical protein